MSCDDQPWRDVPHPTLAGLVPALDLPEERLRPLMRHAGDEALRWDRQISIVGATGAAGLLCFQSCWRTHNRSIVVIPDLLLTELYANAPSAWSRLSVMARHDGRSVAMFAQLIDGESLSFGDYWTSRGR